MQQVISAPQVMDGAPAGATPDGSVAWPAFSLATRGDVGIIDVWQDALVTFAAHAPRILVFTLALVGVHLALNLIVNLTVKLAGLGQARGWPVIAGGIVELAMQTVLRGAIAWVALHGAGNAPVTFRRLGRAIGARWWAFIPGTLICCGLFLTVIAGIGPLLREVSGGPAGLTYTPQTLIASTRDRVTREVIVSSIQGLIPYPRLPWPTSLSPDDEIAATTCDSAQAVGDQLACGNAPAQPFEVTLWALIALAAADILLRFHMAAALLPAGARAHGRSQRFMRWFVPSAHSAGIVLQHGWQVGAHPWLLRLAVACLGGLFVALPVLTATFAQPWVMRIPLGGVLGQALDSSLTDVLSSAVTTLISATVMAFCTIYDMRLFVRLSLGPVKRHRDQASSAR